MDAALIDLFDFPPDRERECVDMIHALSNQVVVAMDMLFGLSPRGTRATKARARGVGTRATKARAQGVR